LKEILPNIWCFISINSRFKLPRNKFSFVGIRNNVSNFVNESLPNITGSINSQLSYTSSGDTFNLRAADESGALYPKSVDIQSWKYINVTGNTSSLTSGKGIAIDASLSSAVYQNDASVQQKAIQCYLEFYCN